MVRKQSIYIAQASLWVLLLIGGFLLHACKSEPFRVTYKVEVSSVPKQKTPVWVTYTDAANKKVTLQVDSFWTMDVVLPPQSTARLRVSIPADSTRKALTVAYATIKYKHITEEKLITHSGSLSLTNQSAVHRARYQERRKPE